MTPDMAEGELTRLTAALKRAELQQDLSVEILGILNEDLQFTDAINRVVAAIRRSTGFDAVGIRLRSDEDFPYSSQEGFSDSFVQTENRLVALSHKGDICRDKAGKPCLECTCGLVISGQVDPSNPIFTANGSFYINRGKSSPGFPSEHNDPRRNARNRCLHEGFNSVALVPIRAHHEIIGLLQLNDRKIDCFPAELIHFLEGLASSIGLALMRKQAEEALSESEKRYRTLFQKSHDALMTLAPPSWQFNSGNTAAVAMFGACDEADFISRAPWQYSPERQPDGRGSSEAAAELLNAAMRDGSNSFEWTHKRLTGEEFPATVHLTRLEINGNALLQGTVRDDSEKKRLQASMAETDRLASMGRLAAGVAHEINNPLAYVRYNIESLAQDLPILADATQRTCEAVRRAFGNVALTKIIGDDAKVLEPAALMDVVERAQESLEGVERIVAITRSLSTFSRVEQVSCRKVDLRVALDSAINMAHSEIRHRARLITDFQQLLPVWASEGKMSQVFLNLLINAAQAIDEGNVADNQITIRASLDRSDVCVEITDTGRGIPPENLERIFEPFYTTKPVGVGSGLGLSISRNILNEYNGSLSVMSNIGGGTCFLVRLPVMQDTPPASPRGPVVDGTGPALPGRILVIEDEAAVRKSLERLLGRNHEIVTVASGEEAQQRVSDTPAFDLILCDVMMAPMSGIEFHAWLAVHHPILARQLVFITGGVFTPKAREYLASVGNLTIEKPFEPKRLRGQVMDMIQESRQLN